LAIIVTAIFYFLILPLLNESVLFLGDLPKYVGTLDSWNPFKTNEFLSSQPVFQGISSGFSIKEIVSSVNKTFSTFSEGFFVTISAIFGGALSFILIVVLSFYLSVQEDGIASFLKLITPFKHRKYVLHLWSRSETKIGLWMQGQLILAFIIAVLVYLGLLLLGVKHALLLAVLAGVFELIPIFGPILAAIPGVAIALVNGGVTLALVVAGMYVIIQQFESQLIYPLVVKKVVGVPPIISIVALIVGAQLAGFLGLLLSVPVAAIMMEYLSDVQKNRDEQEKVGKA
jgi:predicted PurR-regulated permease PerM